MSSGVQVYAEECACGCGQFRPKYDKRGRERKFIHGHKIPRENPLVECACGCGDVFRKYDRWGAERRWKRGHNKIKNRRWMTTQGYVEVWAPDHPNTTNSGYILEHRLVMSEYLGRPLKPGEEVHHKNKNKEDNKIGNLKLYSTKAKHASEDNPRRWTDEEIRFLKIAWPSMAKIQILERLSERTYGAIKEKARTLGFKRSTPKRDFKTGRFTGIE